MKFIRYLSWLPRIVLFVVFVLIAVKNMQAVSLHFFLGQTWELPLIVLLLIFLVFGAVLGVVAWLPRVFRDKREIQALKRRLGEDAPALAPAARPEPIASPPPVDAVI
jgi:uncharacterized integral membrane protein